MCTAKAPKPQTAEEKPVIYMSNIWLDGQNGQGIGRNQLRMDMGSAPRARLGVTAQPSPQQQPPQQSLPAPSGTPAGSLGMGTTGTNKALNVRTQIL